METKEINWEQRRYEIAKSLLIARIDAERDKEKILELIESKPNENPNKIVHGFYESLTQSCVALADLLIKQLKGE